MKISKPTAALLNAQFHNEMGASYTYLGMAAYFETQDLPGFASWFRAQSAEETMHAMKIFDFLATVGVRIDLPAISAPRLDYQSPKSVIETGLAQEQTVTAQIKAIYRSAMDEGDFTVQPMLHWFLEEQVEEEDTFENLLVRVDAAQSKFELLMLDAELASRTPAVMAE